VSKGGKKGGSVGASIERNLSSREGKKAKIQLLAAHLENFGGPLPKDAPGVLRKGGERIQQRTKRARTEQGEIRKRAGVLKGRLKKALGEGELEKTGKVGTGSRRREVGDTAYRRTEKPQQGDITALRDPQVGPLQEQSPSVMGGRGR